MSNEVELPVRQAAVIYLKNMVSFQSLSQDSSLYLKASSPRFIMKSPLSSCHSSRAAAIHSQRPIMLRTNVLSIDILDYKLRAFDGLYFKKRCKPSLTWPFEFCLNLVNFVKSGESPRKMRLSWTCCRCALGPVRTLWTRWFSANLDVDKSFSSSNP